MASNQSVSSPVFLSSAEYLLLRLDAIGAPEARLLAAEVRAIVVTFRAWLGERPTDDVRVTTIQTFFEVNRRAMDFLAKQGPPSSGVRVHEGDADDD